MSGRDEAAQISEIGQSLARAQALKEAGSYEEAEREYARAVALQPADPAAQLGLAKLRYTRGDPRFARDLAKAAARDRGNLSLQLLFANVLRQIGDLSGAEILFRDLIAHHGPSPELRSSLAAILHEAGRLEEAQSEASAAERGRPEDPRIAQNLVAVLLSRGRADEAMRLIRAGRGRAPLDYGWIAHEATAARLMDDPAYAVLYDYDRFVRAYDLEPPPGWPSITSLNAALEASLEARHTLARHPFDQSMRSGTQTMGNLARAQDPAIQAVLKAFLGPITDYRRRLGDADAHPFSARNRGETRYAGCWSVRLKARGFHVNHIHPEGWLSSAYYVAVPRETEDPEQRSGWLKLGEPALPVPGASPGMTVQPRPGRLVLFPSYMWHGTTAIHGNEPRLTMAFDVVTR
jgi:Flp pilus assembly protein TadD